LHYATDVLIASILAMEFPQLKAWLRLPVRSKFCHHRLPTSNHLAKHIKKDEGQNGTYATIFACDNHLLYQADLT